MNNLKLIEFSVNKILIHQLNKIELIILKYKHQKQWLPKQVNHISVMRD